jgi:hypothetical protein
MSFYSTCGEMGNLIIGQRFPYGNSIYHLPQAASQDDPHPGFHLYPLGDGAVRFFDFFQGLVHEKTPLKTSGMAGILA